MINIVVIYFANMLSKETLNSIVEVMLLLKITISNICCFYFRHGYRRRNLISLSVYNFTNYHITKRTTGRH